MADHGVDEMTQEGRVPDTSSSRQSGGEELVELVRSNLERIIEEQFESAAQFARSAGMDKRLVYNAIDREKLEGWNSFRTWGDRLERAGMDPMALFSGAALRVKAPASGLVDDIAQAATHLSPRMQVAVLQLLSAALDEQAHATVDMLRYVRDLQDADEEDVKAAMQLIGKSAESNRRRR